MFYAGLDTRALPIANQILKTLQGAFAESHTVDTMISCFKESQNDTEYVEQLQNYLLKEDLSDNITKKRRIANLRVLLLP
jgi:ER membrane protein complex subunit 2